jgi:hypothetical protein
MPRSLLGVRFEERDQDGVLVRKVLVERPVGRKARGNSAPVREPAPSLSTPSRTGSCQKPARRCRRSLHAPGRARLHPPLRTRTSTDPTTHGRFALMVQRRAIVNQRRSKPQPNPHESLKRYEIFPYTRLRNARKHRVRPGEVVVATDHIEGCNLNTIVAIRGHAIVYKSVLVV